MSKMLKFHSMDGGIHEVEIPEMDSVEYKLQKQVDLLVLGLLQEKNKASDLLEACKKLIIFADEILPQAGSVCFDIGNLNEALCLARPAIAKAEESKNG